MTSQKTLFLWLVAITCVLAARFPAPAQLPAPALKPVVGARQPALSPDGKKLAFVYRGDVWVSDAEGGRAYQVTDHVELDGYPIFSPDGKWLAFSSTRNGNWDVFVVPATGGEARQLTFSSMSEIATDWSPDGKSLLFSTSYDVPNSTIFSLDVDTLRFHKLTEDYKSIGAGTYSPDGKQIIFLRQGPGFPWWRPRYTGSAAAQLWTLSLESGRRNPLTHDEFQHFWPRFITRDGSYIAATVGEATPNAQYLNKPLPPLADNERRTPNLWYFPGNGGPARQLTHFVGDGVRYPAVARDTNDIVFEYGADLYRLPFGGGIGNAKPAKLTLYCGADDKQNVVSREVLTGGVEEAEISPDSKTYAFAVKGDLWTIPVEKPKTRNADDATRLTDYAGFDRDFNWSSDGKTLFFVSDRNFNNRVYALDVASHEVRPVWTGNEDASGPQVSPDGKWLAFWVSGAVTKDGKGTGGLYGVPLQADQKAYYPRRLIAVPTEVQGEFAWSPDTKWIAYTRRGVEWDGMNIWITPADGTGEPVNVSRLNAFHGRLAWSPDGKYLFFGSDRDGRGLYVLPLKPEAARADDLEIKFEKPKKEPEKKDTPAPPPPGPPAPAPPPGDKPAPAAAGPDKKDTKDQPKEAETPVKVEIDFEDTAQRIRKLNTQFPDADLKITDEGKIYFISEGDVWTCGYDGKDAKRLSSGGGTAGLLAARDGKTLFFFRNGGLFQMKPGGDNPTTPITFSANWDHNLRDERKAAFTQFWRSYNNRFYDPNFHGRNWAAIRDRYEPLLDAVGTRDEFAVLLNRMVGELESSHSEIGAARGGVPGPVTRQLGVYFDYTYQGPGIRVRDVPKRAPGSYEKTRIKPGEYIVAVDGKDVTLDENMFKLLNDKGDKDFELLVNATPTRKGARTVKFKALTSEEWGDIHYRNRIERSRKAVDEKSNGRIAYVHIQGMGASNETTFDRELYEYAQGKDAVIIDVRFNGGGYISDDLIDWLGTKPYGIYVPRDGYVRYTPYRGWNKAVAVIMNEHSMSNAEMFPYGMKATGIAKLVGMPTPGYVIGTNDFMLVDGTRARLPFVGHFRADGSPMENMGEKPDVQVNMSAEDWLADRDPQLDAAVDLLMKGLKKK